MSKALEARQIPGWPEYSITKEGRVWSYWTNRWLKPSKDLQGRLMVILYNDKRRACRLHRLVLETYVGPCPQGMECRHLDGIETNNKLDNLKWGTHSENELDKVEHGTISRGEQSSCAKLTESIVLLIRQLWNIRWMDIQQRELAEMFGVSPDTICLIVNRRRWKHI